MSLWVISTVWLLGTFSVNGDFLALFITKNSRKQVLVPRWSLFEFVKLKFVK